MSSLMPGMKAEAGGYIKDEEIGRHDKHLASLDPTLSLMSTTLVDVAEELDVAADGQEEEPETDERNFESLLTLLTQEEEGNEISKSSEYARAETEGDTTGSKGLVEVGQQNDSAVDELPTATALNARSESYVPHPQDQNGNFLEPDGEEPEPELLDTQGDTVPAMVVTSFDQDGRSSAQTKLTNDEIGKWMNYEEHYLGPAPPPGPNPSLVVQDGDGGEAEADASSAFQVTVNSFGTIDLAGGCKTPSSTGTPPPPPESLPEPIPPKEAPPPVVAAATVTTAKTPEPVKQTNGTGGAPKSAAGTKPASGAAASKKPSQTNTTTTAPVKASQSNTIAATVKPSAVKPSKSNTATSPTKVVAASPARASAVTGSPARPASRRASAPPTPTTPGDDANKKVPMNKVKVGTVPSPNLKEVKSKVGSLANATGSGPRKPVVAGGDPAKPAVKIPEQKLAWKAESKVGSFNTGYVRKGGNVKIESKKVEIKEVTSKVGSFNAAYKPGGGEKKIFDDKEYLKKTHSNSSSDHGGSAPHTPRPSSSATNGGAPPATTGDAVATEEKLIDA